MGRVALAWLSLGLLLASAWAQDEWTSVRVIQAAPGLSASSVTVENNGNFSVPNLRFLDITAYYNTSSSASTYKLKVNGKTAAEDSISAPWATVAIMGTVGSAPQLFLHYVDDISGAFETYNGTVRAIHLLPGAPAVTVNAITRNGTIVMDTDLEYMQPTYGNFARIPRADDDGSAYAQIPQGQTLFTFNANGQTLFSEPLFINAGTVYTLWVVPTNLKSPSGQVLMTQDWPPDVPF